MKISITISLFLFFSLYNPTSVLYGQGKSDTTFLMRELDTNGYRAVFFDKRNSRYHHQIIKSFMIDSSLFSGNLKVDGSDLKKEAIKAEYSTVGEWISIYLYNQIAYAYSPSEPYFNLYINVKDNLVILDDFNNGLVPSFIVESKILNSSKITYKLDGLDTTYSQLIFHFLNNDKSIAVVEFPLSKNRFYLVARKQQFFELPIIVNYCPLNRCKEWDFDKIDFHKLLNKSKK